MKRRADEIEAILDALPEEVVTGLAEDLLELAERRVARQGKHEQLEARTAPAKRSRRRRPERPDREP